MGRSKGTVCRLQIREDDDYKTAGLFAAPPQPGRGAAHGIWLYTLTKQEIKTQLRKHGAVRSVTGRPLSFDTLLEQEVLDEQPGDPPLLRTGRKERRDEPC